MSDSILTHSSATASIPWKQIDVTAVSPGSIKEHGPGIRVAVEAWVVAELAKDPASLPLTNGRLASFVDQEPMAGALQGVVQWVIATTGAALFTDVKDKAWRGARKTGWIYTPPPIKQTASAEKVAT